MKIAVLSGKGGAGKTFVAVNLAAAAGKATYIDCDVEEPNGRLFWKPEDVHSTPVCTLLPDFDAEKCSGCRKCVDFCRFHALLYIKGKPMLFPEVCHSCGGCMLICPEGAIPLIREALKKAEGLTVIDCPPGSACSVMESIMDADYCVLVAEPTAFGFHNFQMVHELAALLGKPCGVVINKQAERYMPLESYCQEKGLPVLDRISYDTQLGKLLADNEIAVERLPAYRERFAELLAKIGGGL